MDSRTQALFLCAAISSVRYVSTRVLVKAPSPVVAMMGKEPLSLQCSYRTTDSDDVLSVNWYHKKFHDDEFRQIAQIPNQDVVHLPRRFTDQRLASRGKINFLTKGMFRVAELEINPSECVDEGMYECNVLVIGDKVPHKAKVQVHLNEEPHALHILQNPDGLIENHPATFTCTASIGTPAGTIKWLVYRSKNGGRLDEVEIPGATSFRKMAGICSPIGTSTLTIMVTGADKKVKCVVEQPAAEGVIRVSAERELDVKYRVRDTVIYTMVSGIHLPITRDIVVQKGDNVYLTCRALGNPKPTFKWTYLSMGGGSGSSGLTPKSARADLTLNDITFNQSGSYICVAANNIPGFEYDETRSVRIMVKDRVDPWNQRNVGSREEDGISDVWRYLLIGGVVTGALLFTVFVSLLSVMCIRRCSNKALADETRYTGVNADHGVTDSHALGKWTTV